MHDDVEEEGALYFESAGGNAACGDAAGASGRGPHSTAVSAAENVGSLYFGTGEAPKSIPMPTDSSVFFFFIILWFLQVETGFEEVVEWPQ